MNELVYQTFARRKLATVGKSCDLVFPVEMLKDASKKMKRRCKQVGVRPIRFHDLRHTFASCLAMAGVPLMVIKELMRHQSYSITLKYAHLHPDHLMGATDVLRQNLGILDSKVGHENSPGS